MDRDWMKKNRLSKEYEDGVNYFMNFAMQNEKDPTMISCPCMKCGNLKKLKVVDVRGHLYINGIDQTYQKWIWHGESVSQPSFPKRARKEDVSDRNFHIDMVNDLEEEFADRPDEFVRIIEESEKSIYTGSKVSKMSFLVKMYNIEARNGLSDNGFSQLLSYLSDIFPEGNNIPSSTYEAKKILRSLGMEYEKIHACPNDCILFRNEFVLAKHCPVCKCSRWKLNDNGKEKEGIPAKLLWYIPPIPRFKRLFRNTEHAKSLVWHDDKRIKDGKMRHPADSPSWKNIDDMYPKIASDPRNLRLGLSADGINPHSSMSSNYSCWPVNLVIYNLPPWLCMKRKFVMLSLLISGPKQHGNDIDVYLAPLVDDLKQLWEGIECYDVRKDETFTLRGVLLWTINDFPAYGNLSGHCVKGYKACPICSEQTYGVRLTHCKKVVYMGHRRFLQPTHPFRRYSKEFDGTIEDRIAPTPMTGIEVFDKVSQLVNRFGKIPPNTKDKEKVKQKGKGNKGKGKGKGKKKKVVKVKRVSKAKNKIEDACWKKRSIFFELEYWKHLLLRHNLDVMHIEKNICESIIGTLLNIPGKTKDSFSSRLDLLEMGIRTDLAPRVKVGEKRKLLPAACYNLTKEEKHQVCESLANVKVPYGYSSNIRNLVSIKDLRLIGLKSHDCHALMQQLLPIAIRGISQTHVKSAIIRLCMFFNAICSKTIDVSSLKPLQKEIELTLCLLEQFFPPSFFDVMVHLTVHLVREVELGGPVYMRWMYGFERYMKILKGYVRNRSKPEGCIVECYIAEEAIEFCSEYVVKELVLELLHLQPTKK
ncbi:uncharacterized protein LOC115708932 [Cannabis sativa]|uniref:uncharacterized protein LOC115708932 n=1 Tax=Cannabis sativa TaxID=3483 RepID=UPI0029CA466B|nr:uncharacterized protein LOC115708932 [Cannabis sativa]